MHVNAKIKYKGKCLVLLHHSDLEIVITTPRVPKGALVTVLLVEIDYRDSVLPGTAKLQTVKVEPCGTSQCSS